MNNFLQGPFTDYEIKKAIFQMKADSAPGPDGLTARFLNISGMISERYH